MRQVFTLTVNIIKIQRTSYISRFCAIIFFQMQVLVVVRSKLVSRMIFTLIDFPCPISFTFIGQANKSISKCEHRGMCRLEAFWITLLNPLLIVTDKKKIMINISSTDLLSKLHMIIFCRLTEIMPTELFISRFGKMEILFERMNTFNRLQKESQQSKKGQYCMLAKSQMHL